MSREARSAHSDDPGVLYPLYYALLIQRIQGCGLVFFFRIAPVIFHDNGIHTITQGIFSLLYTLHCPRNRCIYRSRYEASGFRDHLAYNDLISLFHHRLCRSSDMLGHKINHFLPRCQRRDRLIHRYLLHIFGMDTALKCL